MEEGSVASPTCFFFIQHAQPTPKKVYLNDAVEKRRVSALRKNRGGVNRDTSVDSTDRAVYFERYVWAFRTGMGGFRSAAAAKTPYPRAGIEP